MRTLNRRTTTGLGTVPALLAALALAAVAAGPALAKEGFQAFLDAPIGRDTPGGTTLLVGVSVIFPDGSVTHPVEGSPLYLELVGRDGSSVREMGREDRSGHYVFRIEVPPAGTASVDVGVRGTSDLPIELVGLALVPGGIDSKTAQAAPPLAPAVTPLARASVAPPAVAPAAVPATAPAPALGRRTVDGGGRAPRRRRCAGGAPRRRRADARGQPAVADPRPPGVRAGARGLTPSCGRRRPTSPMPPRRCSFGAPRPATRRRTASS